MKAKALILIALGVAICQEAVADHPIPPNSKARWDYRGPPHTITRDSFAKLFSCKTYEELRDALIAAIEDLEHEADDSTPLYVASDCHLALIRTYYLLGDSQNADRLLAQYSSVNRDSKGRLDLSKEPMGPLPILKPAASNAAPDARKPTRAGEQDGGGQPATRAKSK
ncbi:MAG: hypothetical protein ACKVY0_22655 [Prosthecobacter sp.]|uniref:hypothetical protein n=1 Tax=Prosthecobacter sp. TaxID=1965333 RepID=UPI0039008948